MSLAERILSDINRVFVNEEHFASRHTWNGREISCVMDGDLALKRKNNNVVDVGWDNNSRELLFHAAASEFPDGEPQPNTHILFDGRQYKVSTCTNNEGMYEIALTAQETRGLS